MGSHLSETQDHEKARCQLMTSSNPKEKCLARGNCWNQQPNWLSDWLIPLSEHGKECPAREQLLREGTKWHVARVTRESGCWWMKSHVKKIRLNILVYKSQFNRFYYIYLHYPYKNKLISKSTTSLQEWSHCHKVERILCPCTWGISLFLMPPPLLQIKIFAIIRGETIGEVLTGGTIIIGSLTH